MPYNEFGETPDMERERRLGAWLAIALILGIPFCALLMAALAIIAVSAV